MKRVRASRGCKVCTEVFRQSQVKSSMFPRFMFVGHKLCSMPVADCCASYLFKPDSLSICCPPSTHTENPCTETIKPQRQALCCEEYLDFLSHIRRWGAAMLSGHPGPPQQHQTMGNPSQCPVPGSHDPAAGAQNLGSSLKESHFEHKYMRTAFLAGYKICCGLESIVLIC